MRMDIDGAYRRIRIRVEQVTLMALVFHLIIAGIPTPMVQLPLAAQFGSQDSNYIYQMVSDESNQQALGRSLSRFNAQLGSVYIDDSSTFAPPWYLDIEQIAHTRTSEDLVGTDPVAPAKTLRGSVVDQLGVSYDCRVRTAAICSTFCLLKLINISFNEIPETPICGSKTSIHQLQRLGSYVIRAANFMTALLPFSRGFHANIQHVVPDPSDSRAIYHGSVSLSSRSLHDIQMWRLVLRTSWTDTRWLQNPCRYPLLLRRLPLEDDTARALRQEHATQFVGFADGCTTGSGIGIYSPGLFWGSTSMHHITTFVNNTGSVTPLDINLIEFTAAVILTAVLLSHIRATDIVCDHIHLWTDNTACRSWMTKHRAAHPLHLFLLQVFSHLQLITGILVTIGHLPGKVNIYADATSRSFLVPNGPEIRAFLAPLEQVSCAPVLLAAMATISALGFEHISETAPEALTVSVKLLS